MPNKDEKFWYFIYLFLLKVFILIKLNALINLFYFNHDYCIWMSLLSIIHFVLFIVRLLVFVLNVKIWLLDFEVLPTVSFDFFQSVQFFFEPVLKGFSWMLSTHMAPKLPSTIELLPADFTHVFFLVLVLFLIEIIDDLFDFSQLLFEFQKNLFFFIRHFSHKGFQFFNGLIKVQKGFGMFEFYLFDNFFPIRFISFLNSHFFKLWKHLSLFSQLCFIGITAFRSTAHGHFL